MAGVYNFAFGLWAGVFRQAFFEWMALEPARHPAIWACVGMVVGVYGFLYLHAAWKPENAKPIIAVGLMGKVLGPIGMVVTVSQGELTSRMLSLLVLNDLIWWLPFGLFLLEGTAIGTRIRNLAPVICAVAHALALLLMATALAKGTLAEPEVATRIAYIADHRILWSVSWFAWMLSAMSVLGFFAWWCGRIASLKMSVIVLATAFVAVGCDLSAEAIYTGWLPTIPEAARFQVVERTATILSAVLANGLYTFAGIILTVITGNSIGRLLRGLLWIVWAAGVTMSVSGIADWAWGLMVSSGVLFPVFVVCCILLGRALEEKR